MSEQQGSTAASTDETFKILSNDEIRSRLEQKSGARISREFILSRIKRLGFSVIDGATTVICVLETKTDFVIFGKAAVMEPSMFDLDVCKTLAFEEAVTKLFDYEGYVMRTVLSFRQQYGNDEGALGRAIAEMSDQSQPT